MKKVFVNSEYRELDDDATVETVVRELGVDRRGTAVAVNGEVIPRGEWHTTELHDGQEIEVLHATANSWCPPQQQNCGTPEPWPIQFSLVKFGTQVYNGAAGNIWYDDVGLSTSRVGCE